MDLNENGKTTLWLKQRVEGWEAWPSVDDLNEVLRRMGRWRSRLLANTYLQRNGAKVMNGPFAGMAYVGEAAEGALIPRLIGSYESELHPHLQRFAAEGVDCVIDVGCAEGYYAVGLARLLPQATIYAFDTNPQAREACGRLAELNGVSERLVIGEAFEPAAFEAFAGRRALVIMDVEGAEDELLRPDLSPALAGMRLIVETHPTAPGRAGVTGRLIQRFSTTHDIIIVRQEPKTAPLPDWLQAMGHLDLLLAVWEWRGAPTPWLVMEPKRP